MIKENLFKPIDDDHRNSYIKCISDLSTELVQIISQVNSNVNSILECAKNEIKIINDAKRTSEQILDILESSEENFNEARFHFINSYHLWLSNCYTSVIVPLENESGTKETNLSNCNLDTCKQKSIVELEDSSLSDIEIVNEVKYLNPQKVFDSNGDDDEKISRNLLNCKVGNQTLNVLSTTDEISGSFDVDWTHSGLNQHDELVPFSDNHFDNKKQFHSLEIYSDLSKSSSDFPINYSKSKNKCTNKKNASEKHNEKANCLIRGFFKSNSDKFELSSDDQDNFSLEQKITDTIVLNLKKNLHYYSDQKLHSKCFVRLERISQQILNRFMNQKKLQKLLEEDKFLRLIDLSTIEKSRKKKHCESSDSSSSSSSCSLLSRKNKFFTKRTNKKRKLILSDSNISSYYESSDNDFSDKSSCKNWELEQLNSETLDGNEEEAKLRLLKDSDTSEYSDTVRDGEKDHWKNCRKKRKFTKKNSTNSENKIMNKSTWLNDNLLRFKLTNDKYEKKDLEDINNLTSSSSSNNIAELVRFKERKIMKRRRIVSESEFSSDYDCAFKNHSRKSSFSEDCQVEESNSIEMDNSSTNDNLKISVSTSTPNSKAVGRRNIRKVLDDQEIAENTRQAVKDEENRLERLLVRKEQSKYFTCTEESVENNILVLDIDMITKKELISVDRGLVKLLKPHQQDGIRFMWDCCFESVEQVKKSRGSGCILAHCMGLGKTLQVITLVHTLLVNPIIEIKTVMIVCPMNTIMNWVDEFSLWLEQVKNKTTIKIIELTQVKKASSRISKLDNWQKNGGVLIISYDMFRSFTSLDRKFSPVQMKKTRNFLLNPGADLVVCDEGHLLKNEESQLANKMQQVKTQRRIILTGTPLQNNLNEYHCMVQFVKPHLLGSKVEFLNRFGNPITNGQFDNSTPHDVKLMKHRAHVLHRLLEGCVQRRDYAVLTPFLPPKQEYVISVRLSEIQTQMYHYYINNIAKASVKHCNLFKNYQETKRLIAHPKTMQLRVLNMKRLKNLSSVPTPSLPDSHVDSTDHVDSNKATDFWWHDFIKEKDLEDVSISYKLILLFGLLENCEKEQNKVLVFSQCLYTLDVIEMFLKKLSGLKESEANENLFNFEGEWKDGLDYFRLDGRVRAEKRNSMCKKFNDPTNNRARLFLISTKAGGLGINLTGANRVVIFDPSWNPSNDLQSIFRVFRFGQKKPCYVYRLLTAGTMEEKIYNRQVTKLSLSLRVLDEQQVERHYRDSDLTELYKLEPLPDQAPMLNLPKDHLLADVFTKYSKYVYNFFEHDSLLENKEEEELDEEERKQAWLEYHQEKLEQQNSEMTGKAKTKLNHRKKPSDTNVAAPNLEAVVPEVLTESNSIIDLLE